MGFWEKLKKIYMGDVFGSAISEADEAFTTYGANEQAGYRIAAMETGRQGTRFTIAAPDGQTCDYSTRLIGAHNVGNIAGAIAVAHALGVPLDEMRVPVRRLKPVEHRLNLKEHGNATIIDDAYNSNPVGSRAAHRVQQQSAATPFRCGRARAKPSIRR